MLGKIEWVSMFRIFEMVVLGVVIIISFGELFFDCFFDISF